MAPVALFLCLIFIAWLLVRDRRRCARVSAALWIPTVLLLILGSRSVSLWLEAGVPSSMGNAERSPLDQLFYLSVLVGSFVIASSRRVKWSRLFTANSSIMLLYLFFAISVLWSGDPAGSTKRLLKDFGLLFVISVILSEKQPLEAIRTVYVRCACVLFPLSVVFIRYFPRMARSFSVEGEQLFTGVTTQKNTLGEIVLVFSLFLIWDILETRAVSKKRSWRRIPWDRFVLLLMGLWLLYMSKSSTSLLCLLIGTALVLSRGRLASRMVNRLVMLGALSLPALLFFAQEFNSLIAPMVEALGRNMTFTGRTDIWNHITSKTVNPLVGAGYWNFWGGKAGLAIGQSMNTIVPNAHSGYLDIYLDGGVIGLVLLFWMLVACGKRLIANLHVNRCQRLRFAIFIVVIIYNLSESMYFRLSPLWFTTLLVMIDFPFPKTHAKRARKPSLDDEAPRLPKLPEYASQ